MHNGLNAAERAACSLCASPDCPASLPTLRGGGCTARDEHVLAGPGDGANR
jgi:hypothetical protein